MDKQCEMCKADADEIYCQACINQLIEEENREIATLNEDITMLKSHLDQIQREVIKMENMKNVAQTDKIQENKQALEKEIVSLQEKEDAQNKELLQLQTQLVDLERNEDNLWDQINKFTRNLYQLFENSAIADNQLMQLNNELDRLSKLDIVNDLFKISVQDDVSCINNLSIGKKGDQPIDWEEMNAGIGHLSLLLVYLMKKYQYQMQKIDTIECNGSNSRLTNKEKQSFNLYVTNTKDEDEFNEGFILMYLEFGLFCKHLGDGDILSKRKIQLNLPFKMNGQMIADKSVNLRSYTNQKWQNWSDAIKKFLGNVKAVIVMNAQFDISL